MDLISIGTAAQILGVHPDTVREWTQAGRLTASVTDGGHRRYERTEVERLAMSQRGMIVASGEPWDIGLAELPSSAGLFAPGQLVMLAGKSGTGKTGVGEYLIEQTLLQGRSALYVHLEMSRARVHARMCARRDGRHTAREWMDELSVPDGDRPEVKMPQKLMLLTHAYDEFAVADLLDGARLGQVMCEMSQKMGGGFDLVYVDHIGLIDGESTGAAMHGLRAVMQASGALMIVASNAPKVAPADQPLGAQHMAATHMCDGVASVHRIDDDQLHLEITKSRYGKVGGTARLKMNWAQAAVEMCAV